MDPLNMRPAIGLAPGTDLTTLATRARTGDAHALDAVAVGFESMFTSALIKQMRESLEPGTMFGEDTSDVMGGLFDQFMGQHLAQAGMLGISKMVRQQLALQAPRNAEPVPVAQTGTTSSPPPASQPNGRAASAVAGATGPPSSRR